MSELLREIQEDIRAERIQSFWQRFGKSAVWVSVAIVAGTAAGVLWKDYRQSSQMQETSKLIRGIAQYQNQDYKPAIETFQSVNRSASAHSAIAALHIAEAQRADNNNAEAEKTLANLASDDVGEKAPFSALARMKSGVPSVQEGAPFYYSLNEAKGWQLIEQGKKDEAVAIFDTLHRDEKTPESMKQRLLLALQRLAPEKLNAANPQ